MKCSTIGLRLLLLAASGCFQPQSDKPRSGPSDNGEIIKFCADCHALPRSENFAQDHWKKEVEQGFLLYRLSGRNDLTIPDFDATLRFFRDAAPVSIQIPIPERFAANSRFKLTEFPWEGERFPVEVSSLQRFGEAIPPNFLMTDMWTGALSKVYFQQGKLNFELISEVAHPAHLSPADFDQDGNIDFVVADLGTLNPQAEKQGSLWFIRGQSDGTYQRHALRLGLSRVADARPLDHDGDGDLDLIVADFGLHFVGSISLGTNQATIDGIPQFTWEVLDPRPGAISIPVIDFNHDGRPDFFSLVSQHHETIELQVNLGNGKFDRKIVAEAHDPSHGSSGIELVDFDGDGDVDILYTNGDTFDDSLAKPFHGISWLENEGTFPFKSHRIAEMPGCYHAVPADLDGDGDLDLAAVSLLVPKEIAKYPHDTFDGVAWFERLSDGSFRRHSLLRNECQAATLRVADWDSDGDLDLVVPPCNTDNLPQAKLKVFLNER